MIRKFKLKHYKLLDGTIDNWKILLRDITGYKDNFINRFFFLKKHSIKLTELVKQVEQIEPTKIVLSELCRIKVPENIDDISFIAMMELLAVFDNNDDDIIMQMGDVVAISCFSENNDDKFDLSNDSFKAFRKDVEDLPIVDIFGIFNRVVKQLEGSQKNWTRMFNSVNTIDDDYIMAGGDKLNKFNVLNTIKAMCSDFNISYDDAWQLPYSLTQTNSLAKATSSFVENELSRIKEQKMRNNRN